MLALMLGVAACGGGDSTEATGLTKAQLLKQGNALCRRGTDEMVGKESQFLNENRSDIVRAAVENVLPVRVKELRELRALGLPAEDPEPFEAMLEGMEKGIEQAKRDPSSLLAGGVDYAFHDAYVVGIEYGLRDCWLG